MSQFLLPKVAYDLLLALIIIVFAIFHILRLRFKPSIVSNKNQWINIKNVSFLLILSSIIPRTFSVFLFVPAYYGSNHFLNDSSCVYFIYTRILQDMLIKALIHIFIMLRCKVVANATHRVFRIIGYIFVSSDALFMIFVLSGILTGIPNVQSIYIGGQCLPNTDISIYIWFGCADFIIGLYFLFVFVIPLRKYIKVEQEQAANQSETERTARESLSSICRRIVLFSTIMLVTTIVCLLYHVLFGCILQNI